MSGPRKTEALCLFRIKQPHDTRFLVVLITFHNMTCMRYSLIHLAKSSSQEEHSERWETLKLSYIGGLAHESPPSGPLFM